MNYDYQNSPSKDAWLKQLFIAFESGETETFLMEWSESGSHIPAFNRNEVSAKWARLSFHKCSCCPLGEDVELCPAAKSLESTLMKLSKWQGEESVTATAIDGAERQTVVECQLEEVGATLVQMAIFFSDCPVGVRFKPFLRHLRPFATNEELSKHLITQILLKNYGKMATSTVDVQSMIDPLRDVFENLAKRLSDSSSGNAIANSFLQLDAFTVSVRLNIGEIYAEISSELEWSQEDLSDTHQQSEEKLSNSPTTTNSDPQEAGTSLPLQKQNENPDYFPENKTLISRVINRIKKIFQN